MKVQNNSRIKFGSLYQLERKLTPKETMYVYEKLMSDELIDCFVNARDPEKKTGIEYIFSRFDMCDEAVESLLKQIGMRIDKKPMLSYYTEKLGIAQEEAQKIMKNLSKSAGY